MKRNEKVQRGHPDGLMTARQFAERTGMSYEWVRKRLQRRQIAFVRLGRAVRITEGEFERLVSASTVPVAQERAAR